MSKKQTPLGTPCSPAWDEDWIREVTEAERKHRRRVCGARTLAGTPCTLPPNHANGRCKFHGGFDLTGAQPGNRNAVVHGLYSRGLQRCGEHCPLWESCPCAGKEVADLSPKERPECPYEKSQYQAAVSDALTRLPKAVNTDPAPHYAHLAHQTALLRVMMIRAAAALGQAPMVDAVSAKGGNGYSMDSSKPSAYLQAFLRLSSEHRRYLQLIEDAPALELDDWELKEHARRGEHDTELAPEHVSALEPSESLAERRASIILTNLKKNLPDGQIRDLRYRLWRVTNLASHVVEPEQEELEAALAAREAP